MSKLAIIGFLSAAAALSFFCSSTAHNDSHGHGIAIAQVR